MPDTYYDCLCHEVRTILSRHVKRILGSRRGGETEHQIQEIMKDLEYTFRDYGVDWKLADVEGSKK